MTRNGHRAQNDPALIYIQKAQEHSSPGKARGMRSAAATQEDIGESDIMALFNGMDMTVKSYIGCIKDILQASMMGNICSVESCSVESYRAPHKVYGGVSFVS